MGRRGERTMNQVTGVNGTYSTQSVRDRLRVGERPTVDGAHRPPEDAVEISDVGAMMSRLKEVPEIREDLVARVRAEIDAGTYETPERLEQTVDRLMEEFV